MQDTNVANRSRGVMRTQVKGGQKNSKFATRAHCLRFCSSLVLKEKKVLSRGSDQDGVNRIKDPLL